MTKIKLNNVEVDKAELVKFCKENPQLFKEKGKPLGDDFSMLGYLEVLKCCMHYYPKTSIVIETGLKRLNALIKIWEWKEKNDDVVIDDWSYLVLLHDRHNKFKVRGRFEINNPELPRFSSEEIAERALKELKQEYKIVFNVK